MFHKMGLGSRRKKGYYSHKSWSSRSLSVCWDLVSFASLPHQEEAAGESRKPLYRFRVAYQGRLIGVWGHLLVSGVSTCYPLCASGGTIMLPGSLGGHSRINSCCFLSACCGPVWFWGFAASTQSSHNPHIVGGDMDC